MTEMKSLWVRKLPVDQWPANPVTPLPLQTANTWAGPVVCLASIAPVSGAQAGAGLCALLKTSPSKALDSGLTPSLQSLSIKLALEPEPSQQGSATLGNPIPQTV